MTSNVTQILSAIEAGDRQAANQLLPLVYDELRRLASQKMTQEKSGQTLQPTALVHEAFLRLVGAQDRKQWDGRGHFFAAAAEAMRRILIDSARRRNAEKRGGGMVRCELKDEDVALEAVDCETLLSLDEALTKVAAEVVAACPTAALRFAVRQQLVHLVSGSKEVDESSSQC